VPNLVPKGYNSSAKDLAKNSTSLLTKNECVMNIKISFATLSSRLKSNGEVPIYCYLAAKNETNRFSTGNSLPIALWDSKKQKVKGSNNQALLINRSLDELKKKIETIQLKMSQTEGTYSLGDIINQLNGRVEKHPNTLMAVYKVKFDKMNKLVGKDYHKSTLDKYSQMAKSVQEFIKEEYKIADIQLNKLNRVFLEDLELYLRTNKDMKTITSNKVIQGLKSVIRYSLERNWIERDPFIGHKSKSVQTEIVYLTNEQITLLETTILSQQRLTKIKDLFLFSIYTGLHFADAMSLTKSNLIIGIDNKPWIEYIRGKTGRTIKIPLLNKAQALLVKFKVYGLADDYIIPRISNQKMNSYLKEISDILDFDVVLTHKIARKTFGSILLYHNIPIKVVSELMGHSNSLITERHYAKLDTRKLGEAISSLNM